jgi:hypothetical protein
LRWINAVAAQAAHTARMILFGRQQIAPAFAAEHDSDSDRDKADAPAWTSSSDLMTVPAAWPVAVSALAQRLMACQAREMHRHRG